MKQYLIVKITYEGKPAYLYSKHMLVYTPQLAHRFDFPYRAKNYIRESRFADCAYRLIKHCREEA